MQDLPSAYDPKATEEKIYQTWEKSGYFNPDKLPLASSVKRQASSYTIVVPPPNVTGSLHMGHALNATIQDILIRKKRMEGYQTLWLPGTDHAGIATQNVVEKDLKKQGLSRHDLGREKFLEKVWEWKNKYGDIILNQFKRLGCSMDWSRTRFTMDPNYQKAVETAFLHYYKKGWLYKAERVINWCTRCQTSLSDLEVEHKEENGKLWYIKYPIVVPTQGRGDNYVIVATTRPETMLGDVAAAVNPKDKRYKKLVGKKVLLPIQNREIPIIADDEVDMEFGTGAVKVTPAHDLLDARIGEKHNLPIYKVISPLGKMISGNVPSEYTDLKVKDCREKVVAELQKQNLIEKEENYTHNVALCYRCNTVIEPLPSLQWFLKMEELARVAIKAVKSGKVKFYPKNWEKIYFSWLENIHDWNISRQIWWGHKIPLEGENDVLDTWFSSALWPFATLGWPMACGQAISDKQKAKSKKLDCVPIDGSDLKKFYPTQVLSTARDIINLWVARMVFSSYEFLNVQPFTDVVIHGTILAKSGQRMSKSLGTGVDPMELIEKYGADATRFGLIWQAMGNQDIRWDENAVVAGKKFANKVWNIARYILNNLNLLEGDSGPTEIEKQEDKKFVEKLKGTKIAVSKQIDTYQFGQALHNLYDFIWHDLADKYLEHSKGRADTKAKSILQNTLLEILKMLHPFMPHLTEAIYQQLPHKEKEFIMIETWN